MFAKLKLLFVTTSVLAILFCLLTSFSVWLVFAFGTLSLSAHYKVTDFISDINYFG